MELSAFAKLMAVKYVREGHSLANMVALIQRGTGLQYLEVEIREHLVKAGFIKP